MGYTPPLEVEKKKYGVFACHPPVVSNQRFTIVFRALSGFGVADGVRGTVLVTVLVNVADFSVAVEVGLLMHSLSMYARSLGFWWWYVS